MYSVKYNKDIVLEKSQLGLKTNTTDYSDNLGFKGSKSNSVEKTYESQKLKKSEFNYKGQELTCTFINEKGQEIDLVFRTVD